MYLHHRNNFTTFLPQRSLCPLAIHSLPTTSTPCLKNTATIQVFVSVNSCSRHFIKIELYKMQSSVIDFFHSIFSRFIHFMVCITISCLLWLNNIPLYDYTTFCLHIHNLGIWVISTFWLFQKYGYWYKYLSQDFIWRCFHFISSCLHFISNIPMSEMPGSNN